MELGLITVYTVCNVTDKRSKFIEQYHDVFKGLGCLGEEYHIDVREERVYERRILPVHVP